MELEPNRKLFPDHTPFILHGVLVGFTVAHRLGHKSPVIILYYHLHKSKDDNGMERLHLSKAKTKHRKKAGNLAN
jgi:hypothetical protein